MTELEFEKLKARVDSLEAEVKMLRSQVMLNEAGDTEVMAPVVAEKLPIAVAAAENIVPVTEKSEYSQQADVQPQRITIPAKSKKIIYTDAEGVRRKNGHVSYSVNGINYIAVTEADLPDSLWKAFEQQQIFIDCDEDILHPAVTINGIRLELFGHVDTGDFGWRRVRNSESGQMEFMRVLPDENSTAAGKIGSERAAGGAEGIDIHESKKDISAESNFEKMLGTKWMGIFASVLIFVAFILFGASIYSFLSEVTKSIVLFAISGAFIFTGVRKLEKASGNTALWNIVSGCGIGGCYITILLMFLVFNIIGLVTLSLLLVLWVVATVYLAKRFSKVFYYVCYTGVLISTGLCESMWSTTLVSFIFYIVAMLVIIGSDFDRSYKANYFWMLQMAPVFIYFAFIYNEHIVAAIVLWVVLLAIVIAQPFIFEISSELDTGVYVIGQMLPSLLAVFVLAASIKTMTNESVYAFGIAASILLMLISTAHHFSENRVYVHIWFYLAAVILPLLPYHEIYEKYIGYAVFMIPALIYGFISDRTKYQGTGAAYLAIYFFIRPHAIDDNLVSLLSLVAVIALIGVCFLKYVEWLRIYLLVFIAVAAGYVASEFNWYNAGICFIIWALTAFCINTVNFTHENPVSEIIVKIYTVLVTISGYFFAGEFKDDLVLGDMTVYGSAAIYGIVIILAALALNVLCNRYSYWLKITDSKTLAGIAAGSGYLFMVLALTERFDAAGIVVSLLLIILAICFIASGFKSDIKAIRLYGLILSIICTIKLVFFDIHYESNIYYPIGLFICGGMCLFICWLYNRIEKNNLDKEQGDEAETEFEAVNGVNALENKNEAESDEMI